MDAERHVRRSGPTTPQSCETPLAAAPRGGASDEHLSTLEKRIANMEANLFEAMLSERQVLDQRSRRFEAILEQHGEETSAKLNDMSGVIQHEVETRLSKIRDLIEGVSAKVDELSTNATKKISTTILQVAMLAAENTPTSSAHCARLAVASRAWDSSSSASHRASARFKFLHNAATPGLAPQSIDCARSSSSWRTRPLSSPLGLCLTRRSLNAEQSAGHSGQRDTRRRIFRMSLTLRNLSKRLGTPQNSDISTLLISTGPLPLPCPLGCKIP